jgi:peptidoglycan/LPS O-acetylase OafA/YrhL
MMSYALSSVGSVLVLLSFLGVSPKLLPGWAIYMGRISFGLYAYHGFGGAIAHQLLSDTFVHSSGLVYFMDSLLSLGLTMLTAMLSYRYFETPFLKMKKRHSVIQSQPVRGES